MPRHRDRDPNTGRPLRERRTLLRVAIWLLALYGLGFALFVGSLPRPSIAPGNAADAIVALTGEGGRLAPAVSLLEQGGGKRLLITGVNQATSKRNLRELLEDAGEAFDCCADLGFAATDTRGNAAEAAAWVHEHDYRSLIVVTNSYHMPRSLAEFAAKMPGIELIPFPVPSERDPTPWQSLRRLHAEYAKYLASVARITLQGLLDGTTA